MAPRLHASHEVASPPPPLTVRLAPGRIPIAKSGYTHDNYLGASMGDKQLLGTSQMPEINERDTDQLLKLQESFLLGNNTFIIRMENITAEGLKLVPFATSAMKMNIYASSSSSSDIENVRLLSSGPSVESYPHLSGVCFSQFPLTNVQPLYSQQTTYGDKSVVNMTENGKCLKRKRSAASTVCDVINTDGYYMGGTSSEFCSSSSQLFHMPPSGSQVQHWDINDINSSYKCKRLSIAAQPSQRNVKTKLTSASQFCSSYSSISINVS